MTESCSHCAAISGGLVVLVMGPQAAPGQGVLVLALFWVRLGLTGVPDLEPPMSGTNGSVSRFSTIKRTVKGHHE